MKKLLIIALVVFAVIGAAIALFIATFNADRYRPALVKNIEGAIGFPVELGHLSLAWRGGIAVELKNLAVYSDREKRLKPGIRLESASAVVRFLPLLRRDVQFKSILLQKPYLEITRTSGGDVKVGGIPAAAPGAAAKPSSGVAAQPIPLSIDSIRVENGQVILHDRQGAKPVDLEIKDLDVKIKGFSLSGPFSFSVAASLLSDRQNIALAGRVRLPDTRNAGFLENTTLKTDLGDLDTQKLSKSFPDIGQALGSGRLAGKLDVSIGHLDLGGTALDRAKAKLELKGGRVALAQLKSPFEQIDSEALLDGDTLSVKRGSARFADGTLQLSGNVSRLKTQPLLSVKAEMRDLAIDAMMQNVPGNAPQLNGRLSMGLEGTASGIRWEEIQRTLQGRARILLKDGVLLNYNLLREVIQKISVIPGVEQTIQTQFPQATQARLNERSTILQPLDLSAQIINGLFVFNTLSIATDVLSIDGAGQVGLDKTIRADASLRMNPELSGVLAQNVPQVQLLMNGQGQLELPLHIEGSLPQILVVPDARYIAAKLMAVQAQQMMGGVMQKNSQEGPSVFGALIQKISNTQS